MKWLAAVGLACGLGSEGAQVLTQVLSGIDDDVSNSTDQASNWLQDLDSLEDQLTSFAAAPNKGKNGKMQNSISKLITKTMLPSISREHVAAQRQLYGYARALKKCKKPASSRRSKTTYSVMRRAARVHRVCRFRQARVGKSAVRSCRLVAKRLRAKKIACNGLKAVKRNPANSARLCKPTGASRFGTWVAGIVRHFAKKKRQYYYFKRRCSTAARNYRAVWPRCRKYRRNYRGYKRRCYSRQSAVDSATCAYRSAVRQSCIAYRACYYRAWRAYVYRRRIIRKAESDRKIQYRVLKRITCLLSGPIKSGKSKDIEKCRKKIWSTRHLNLRYPRVAKKHKCRAPKASLPCTKRYIRSVYGKLPRYGRAQRCRRCPRKQSRVVSRRRRVSKCRHQRPVLGYIKRINTRGGCYWRGQGARKRLPLNRSPYTIEAWILPNKGNAHGGMVGWGWYGRKNQVNAFRQWGNKGLVNYWWGNDLSKYGIVIQNKKWHHVAATFDGSHRRIWFDFRLLASKNNRNYLVRTKKNFCVGKTYKKEYFKGQMSHVAIWSSARSGSLMKARGQATPRVWMRGYRAFRRNRCVLRSAGKKARLPLRKSHYTIEARIKPHRRTAFSGGIVGWGHYKRRNSVNALRVAGKDGLYNYYWGNDLYASGKVVRRRGRRLHDGRYHHVAATFDGWYQRLYVDFRQVRIRRTSGPVSLRYKNNFCIGKTYNREYFRGAMGEVKIYTWARSTRQMRKKGC